MNKTRLNFQSIREQTDPERNRFQGTDKGQVLKRFRESNSREAWLWGSERKVTQEDVFSGQQQISGD